jgi:hypothetical protein
VLDPCVELTKVRMKIRELCLYIMDKKNKSRFKELKALSMDIWKCDCTKLEIPNATRVAGFYRILQSLIWNKHLLENAQKSNAKHLEELVDHALTENEWVEVAQIECILKRMTTLNMDMQSDIPGTYLYFFTFSLCCSNFYLKGRQG